MRENQPVTTGSTFPVVATLEYFIPILERYERGEADTMPYISAQILRDAKEEIERLRCNNS